FKYRKWQRIKLYDWARRLCESAQYRGCGLTDRPHRCSAQRERALLFHSRGGHRHHGRFSRRERWQPYADRHHWWFTGWRARPGSAIAPPQNRPRRGADLVRASAGSVKRLFESRIISVLKISILRILLVLFSAALATAQAVPIPNRRSATCELRR